MKQILAGIDVGGTTIKAALAELDGTIIEQTAIPTDSHRGPGHIIDRIASLLKGLATKKEATIAGLGMGLPGLLDVVNGISKFLPNLPTQWREIPVAARLRDRLGCPVKLLNDVRMATLGELRFGHGKSEPRLTMVFFAIGTGIGGGVAIEGKLRLGPLGAAGELGHQTIAADGPYCGCGSRGCLEAFASGPAISAEGVRLMQTGLAPRLFTLVDGDANKVTPKEILQAGQNGDRCLLEAIERAGSALGIAAANLVTAIHPDLVVIGGGVAELGDPLLDPVRREIRQRVRMFPADGVRVEPSLLGERAGIVGAIALAQDALRPPP